MPNALLADNDYDVNAIVMIFPAAISNPPFPAEQTAVEEHRSQTSVHRFWQIIGVPPHQPRAGEA
ncbi:hypothetical protein CES85_3545 (plasmid) [Ochrobactrum quorumnocens]|uniref:Uncharacterized protein n=1 Tax=Ochrobactrum quorumnocens TaxID=271865 RepID=A0A248UP39_9HYPH|nr:hypothetical protein CES85_3545 [[Ochrobactrum] quorumnocens]